MAAGATTNMTRNQYQALSIAIFPMVLAIGILTIPVVTDYADHALAEQAAGQTARWFWGHLICAVAFGLGALAACSIAGHLHQIGEGPDVVGLPLTAVGAALQAAGLGADGIGPLAVAATGSSAQAYFDGSATWVTGVFIAGSMTFGAGLIVQVICLIRAGVITGPARRIVFIAAITFAGAGAIPSGWGLYGVAAAALVVYLPISGPRRNAAPTCHHPADRFAPPLPCAIIPPRFIRSVPHGARLGIHSLAAIFQGKAKWQWEKAR